MPRRRQLPAEHISKHAGQYGQKIMPENEARAASIRAAEEWAMELMLRDARYAHPRQYAKALSAEGMGPEELRVRMRRPTGAVGSLQYTHNMVKR